MRLRVAASAEWPQINRTGVAAAVLAEPSEVELATVKTIAAISMCDI